MYRYYLWMCLCSLLHSISGRSTPCIWILDHVSYYVRMYICSYTHTTIPRPLSQFILLENNLRLPLSSVLDGHRKSEHQQQWEMSHFSIWLIAQCRRFHREEFYNGSKVGSLNTWCDLKMGEIKWRKEGPSGRVSPYSRAFCIKTDAHFCPSQVKPINIILLSHHKVISHDIAYTVWNFQPNRTQGHAAGAIPLRLDIFISQYLRSHNPSCKLVRNPSWSLNMPRQEQGTYRYRGMGIFIPTLNPVGAQSTKRIFPGLRAFPRRISIAILTSFGVTSPRKRKDTAINFPSLVSHLTIWFRGSKRDVMREPTVARSWKAWNRSIQYPFTS
jgi:hypothetical protein